MKKLIGLIFFFIIIACNPENSGELYIITGSGKPGFTDGEKAEMRHTTTARPARFLLSRRPGAPDPCRPPEQMADLLKRRPYRFDKIGATVWL